MAVTLYINFIDFEKAFDRVDRDVIWMLVHHYGIPAKFVTLIQQMYENSTCQVIHHGKLSETFEVKTGVRQECILSPLIFVMVIDWIIRKAVKQNQNGIQWTFTKQLDDLDFADDICLLSHTHKHMQKKSIQKTKLLKVNSTQQAKVQLKGKDIEEDNKFTYMGSVVTDKGRTNEDVKNRIGKARHAFSILKTVWNTPSFSTRNKIRILNTNVKSVLLYGSETRRVTKTTTRMLQTFINKCLRYILKTKWQDKTTNKEIWRRTDQHSIRRTDQHSIRRDCKKKRDTDRTHPPKTNQQCHKTGLRLESTREKKNRQTQNYLEEINRRGSKETWNHLERNEESSKQ